MIKLKDETSNIAYINLRGDISMNDFKSIEPSIEELFYKHATMNLIMDYEGVDKVSSKTAWDDFKYQVRHHRDFAKIAILGVEEGLFGDKLKDAEIRYFLNDGADLAKSWIRH